MWAILQSEVLGKLRPGMNSTRSWGFVWTLLKFTEGRKEHWVNLMYFTMERESVGGGT